MRASLVELDLDQVDSSGRPLGEGRSTGVHLSQIIKWARENTEGKLTGGNPNFMSMGWILEVMLERGFKDFSIMTRKNRADMKRPGELELDGIFGTPDWLDGDIVEEDKLTYKSLRRLTGSNIAKGDCGGDVEAWLKRHHWWWLVQIMGYCWMLGTEKARLVSLFVNGDYSFSESLGGPQLIVVNLAFDTHELHGNWETVKQYKSEMLAEVA